MLDLTHGTTGALTKSAHNAIYSVGTQIDASSQI